MDVTPDARRQMLLLPKGRRVMLRTFEGFSIAWPLGSAEGRGEKPRAGCSGPVAQSAKPEKGRGGSPVSARVRSGSAKEGLLISESVGSVSAVTDHAFATRLQKWVRQTAAAQKVEPFLILNRQTVEAIASARPTTFEALGKVRGMGPAKVQRYGRTILDLLASETV